MGASVTPGAVVAVWVNPGAAILTFPVGSIDVQLEALALDAFENVVHTPISWSTTDQDVANVDETGYVVGNRADLAYVTASADGVTSAPVPIVVECVPARCTREFQMSFTQMPSSTPAGDDFSPPVRVSLSRPFGPGTWSGSVWLVLERNPHRATLTGGDGVAVNQIDNMPLWGDVQVDRPGAGYTLIAIVQTTAGDVWATRSGPFEITQ